MHKIYEDIPFCCRTKRNQSSIDEFFEFLSRNGCNLKEKLKITCNAETDDFRLQAKRKFSENECIFEIPLSLMITINDAKQSRLSSLIKNDKMLSYMPNVTLALFILYLKTYQANPNEPFACKWKSYLNILPDDFHTPLYFNLQQLKLLQPTQCFSKLFQVSIFRKI